MKDISLMTGFTTRTLRSYIKNGLLKGSCINRKWIFTEEELYQFFSNDFVMEGIVIKCNASVKQFMRSMKRLQPEGCFIYDLPGSKEEVGGAVQKLIVYLKENTIIKFSFYYKESYKVGRFIFIGALSEIEEVIKVLNDRKK